MKVIRWLGLPIGIGILLALVIHQDIAHVFAIIRQAGWVLLWLIPFHALPLLLDAFSWYLLLKRKLSLWYLWWVACVREAVNRLLPVVGIGGEVVGIRMALWRYTNRYAVTASVIVEVLITIIVQYVFAALSIIFILSTHSDAKIGIIVLSLIFSLPIPFLLFVLIKRGGIFLKIERFAGHFLGNEHRFLKHLEGKSLDQQINDLMSRLSLLLKSFFWQLSGYALGAIENYIALLILGFPISVWDALAIEGLTQAVRHAAFMIPGGLGVQEATVILLAQLFGVNHEVALSLALVKRMREVIFGILSLVTWQIAELFIGKRQEHLKRNIN